MTSTYIHTQQKAGFSTIVLRLITALYFLAIIAAVIFVWSFAQDRFVTTAAFKISRQDNTAAASSLMQLALPGLTDSASIDSQITIGYIQSADLLLDLENEFDLITHYSQPDKDFVFRLNPDDPLEERLEYYRKRITAHFNPETGLTMISVDTFEPKLSHDIGARILEKAEAFVNKINQQVADQQLAFIRSEVDRTAERVNKVNSELLALQNKHQFINPEEVISSSIQALEGLQIERLRIEAELSSILRDSPESPLIDTLRSRLRSLNEVIDIETAKLSGSDRDTLNQVLIEFKEVQLKLEFATRLQSGAEMMLEKNRVEAVSRSRFFSVIQNPFLPEDAALPRRSYTSVSIIALGLLIFLIFRALTNSVFDGS